MTHTQIDWLDSRATSAQTVPDLRRKSALTACALCACDRSEGHHALRGASYEYEPYGNFKASQCATIVAAFTGSEAMRGKRGRHPAAAD